MYQCSGCDKFFLHRGPHAAHRVGSHQLRQRRCLATEEMVALSWTSETIKTGKNAGKTIWRMPAKEGGLPDFNVFGKVKGNEEADVEIEEEEEEEI